MKKFIIYTGIAVLFASCGSTPETNVTSEVATTTLSEVTFNKEQQRNAGVQLELPKRMNIGAIVQVSGSVEVPPQNKTAISFPFGGFVKSIPVLDGMNIRKGQVLITLEDPTIIQLQQDYLEAKGQLEFQELEYERQKTLNDQQVNSQKALQLSKSNYLSTLARCKGMKLKLEMAGVSPSQVEKGNLQREISIRAPFDGVVTKMNAEVGHYVTPQEVLLELIDLKHGHIELSVFEKDVAALKVGQKVNVYLLNNPEPKSAKVFLIGREIGSNRMVKVHCHLEKEDPSLIPGSFIRADIELTDTKQLTVPSDAVVNLKGKTVVFTVKTTTNEGEIYQVEEVEVLGEEAGRSAIRYRKDGNDESKVVVKGAYAILSNLLVKMEPEE